RGFRGYDLVWLEQQRESAAARNGFTLAIRWRFVEKSVSELDRVAKHIAPERAAADRGRRFLRAHAGFDGGEAGDGRGSWRRRFPDDRIVARGLKRPCNVLVIATDHAHDEAPASAWLGSSAWPAKS